MTEAKPCTCDICGTRVHSSADAGLARTVARVEKFGFSLQGGADYDEDEPDWAYTIGLWHSFRVPELSMFGLDVEDMVGWLDEAAGLVTRGLRPEPGDVVPGVLEGFLLQVRPVDTSWYEGLFGQLLGFYGGPVPMLQLVWPDKKGRLPWEEGVGARCHEWQPQLWIPVAQHTVGPWQEIATERQD